MSKSKRGLGRSLSEILGATPGHGGADIREIAIEDLAMGPWQPRRRFDSVALDELALTISRRGILQPLVVRRAGNKMQVVAGERRWRAAKMAGLRTVPVIVREMSKQDALVVATIENIQREDLQPLEQAAAIRRIMHDLSLSHPEVAKTIGMSRSTTVNLLRLLDLEPTVRQLLSTGSISSSHARAVASLAPNIQLKAAQKVVAEGLNVRQTEQLVRVMGTKRKASADKGSTSSKKATANADTQALCEHLSETLGMRATIRTTRNAAGGTLMLHYRSLANLDRLIALLSKGSKR